MVTVRGARDGDGWSCVVSVENAGVRRIHKVRVDRDDLDRWGAGTERRDVESLVARSFDFLLEREPPSAILATFDLSVIQRYFPEYDRTFRRREDK
ncbi:MAG: hypothetical protein E6I95_12265 [Chloroflexi bacterium]|nr:MAG: hypothetical protein E6I95_12265 [Chloroflexota bacterium]